MFKISCPTYPEKSAKKPAKTLPIMVNSPPRRTQKAEFPVGVMVAIASGMEYDKERNMTCAASVPKRTVSIPVMSMTNVKLRTPTSIDIRTTEKAMSMTDAS